MWWLKRFLCSPKFKWIGITLIAVGAILLIIFVPIKLWLAVLGILLIVLGILLMNF